MSNEFVHGYLAGMKDNNTAIQAVLDLIDSWYQVGDHVSLPVKEAAELVEDAMNKAVKNSPGSAFVAEYMKRDDSNADST